MYKSSRKFFIAVVFSILLWPVIAAAQLPDRTDEHFSTKTWEDYTRNQLLKLSPEDTDLIKQLHIMVINDDRPNAGSDWETSSVVIFKGLIRCVDSEGEYAYVIAHEFGHIKLKQPDPIIIYDYGIIRVDFERYFEGERAADQFAQEKLIAAGYDGCAGYIIAKKTFGDRALANPEDPHNKVLIRRLEFMLADCKQSMPQIPGKPSPR